MKRIITFDISENCNCRDYQCEKRQKKERDWTLRVNFTIVFMCSFYACRSQKCKKDSRLKQLFALLGSEYVKAARKHVDENDPWFTLSLSLLSFIPISFSNIRQWQLIAALMRNIEIELSHKFSQFRTNLSLSVSSGRSLKTKQKKFSVNFFWLKITKWSGLDCH